MKRDQHLRENNRHGSWVTAYIATKLYHQYTARSSGRFMIKLQLLLRHPGSSAKLDQSLCALLDSLGIVVTGSGCASVTAQIADEDFQRLFGPLPVLQSGFTQHLFAAPEPHLPVPPDLLDAISLITLAPRHTAATHTAR